MANKACVFTFGRFNPPSLGHAKLINKVVEYAHRVGAENRIYASHSHDSNKNPLPYSDKISFLRQLFPLANVIEDKTAISAFQIARELSDKGYTDIIMIVGEDRTEEFETQIKKYIKQPNEPGYDKKKHYTFKSFKVISAGQRDPNAKGVEGISGTKMREFVKTNDFASFAKNTPTNNITLARKIFNTVKRNMLIKEAVQLDEGCNDKAIFKAVFLAGGPGSGKDFVMKKVLWGFGLVEINSDNAFEFLMKKEKMDFKMPDSEKIQRDMARGRAKNMTKEKERLALNGRLGLIINGTGDDYHQVETIKRGLENLGYETRILYVNTVNEVSRARNKLRGILGGREVPETIRHEKWRASQINATHLAKLFGQDYFEFDNSTDLAILSPELKKEKESIFLSLYKKFRNWVTVPATNPIAINWISNGGRTHKLGSMGLNELFKQEFNGIKDYKNV